MKVVLAVLGVLVVMALLAIGGLVATGFVLSKTVHVERDGSSGSGEKVKVDTPLGTIRVQTKKQATWEQLDIPVYPGASLVDDAHGSASVDIDMGGLGKSYHVSAGGYRTSDPPETVIAFYREKLSGCELKASNKKREAAFICGEGANRRVVGISRKGAGTEIGLAAVGNPPEN